jgi:two-component system, chemotaxis family, sensor kinase CheA
MSTNKEKSEPTGFDQEMAEILESFIVETREIMERLGQELLELEKRPTDPELHNSIFRAVHTIKGTSSFLGFEQLTALAHRCEDVLNKIRRGELTVTAEGMDIIVEGYDVLKLLLQKIESHDNEPIDMTELLEKLGALALGSPMPATPAAPAEVQEVPAADAVSEQSVPVAQAPVEVHEQGHEETAKAQSADHPATAAAAQGARAKQVDSTIRVDVARLDSLMNLVGELVLGRNRLSQIAFQLGEQYEGIAATKDLSETSSQIDFITTELQMAVMKTRMVPIAKVFNKLPRLIRDLCRETGKDIDFQMFGEETELDKSIIEELNDPLVHIIRNAADHGVEMPADRKASGKPEKGTVVVKAEHVGNHIVISIMDDGKGMDPEKLKAKGIEKGLITEAQAREMSKREAYNLIFAPGFSTAAKVTNVSGRGVGMDVVRTNIAKLKGIVEIESEIGKGSTFIIKLPLTLAIIQGLLVEASNEIFSIPLGSVLEVVRARQDEIATVNGHEVIRLRNTVLPLARIGEVLGGGASARTDDWRYIVVVGLADQRLGVVVDSLLGQKEVVIKTLGGYLGKVPGIAGSTILGDGRVIMIVDVGEFMNLCMKTETRPHQVAMEMAEA